MNYEYLAVIISLSVGFLVLIYFHYRMGHQINLLFLHKDVTNDKLTELAEQNKDLKKRVDAAEENLKEADKATLYGFEELKKIFANFRKEITEIFTFRLDKKLDASDATTQFEEILKLTAEVPKELEKQIHIPILSLAERISNLEKRMETTKKEKKK